MKVSAIFISSILYATSWNCFAWEPCKPFCDAGCSGAAIDNMGVNVSSKIADLTGSKNNLSSSLNETINAFTDFSLSFESSQIEKQESVLTAMDGFTKKITFNDVLLAKYLSAMAEQTTFAIVNALKYSQKLEFFHWNANQFDVNGCFVSPYTKLEAGSFVAFIEQLSTEELDRHSLASITYEAFSNRLSSQLSLEEQSEWLEENADSTSGEDQARKLGFRKALANKNQHSDLRDKAIVKLEAIISARQIFTLREIENDKGFSNFLTVLYGDSVDTIIRGDGSHNLLFAHEYYVGNSHNIQSRLVFASNAKNINLQELLKVGRDTNLLKSLSNIR